MPSGVTTRVYQYRIELGSKYLPEFTHTSTGIVMAYNPHDAFTIIRLMPEYTGLPVYEIEIQNVQNGHLYTWHPSRG